MPIDKQLIEGLLDDIRSRLAELRVQEVTIEKLGNKFFLWGVEHGLQTILEAVLDIARHIVASQAWGVKPRARDYMAVLGEKGVIEKSLSDKLAEAMSVRNRLVHEYGQISKEKLAEFVTRDLDDIDEYLKQINGYINDKLPLSKKF